MPPGEDLVSAAVGSALRRFRTDAGLSMRALAEIVGVSQPLLSQIENGRTMPSISTLYRLAAALGVAPGDLMPAPGRGDIVVTRHDEGSRVPTSEHPASAIGRVLSSGASGGLEFIEYRVHPSERLDDWFEFAGELVVYVVEGRLEVEIAGRGVWEIGPREAVHHDASLRHRWRVVGDEPAFLLFAAVRPPSRRS